LGFSERRREDLAVEVKGKLLFMVSWLWSPWQVFSLSLSRHGCVRNGKNGLRTRWGHNWSWLRVGSDIVTSFLSVFFFGFLFFRPSFSFVKVFFQKVFELLFKISNSRVHSARGMRSPHPGTDLGLPSPLFRRLIWFPHLREIYCNTLHNVVKQVTFLLELMNTTVADSTNESPTPIFISCQRDGCILAKFRPSCLVVRFLCGTLIALSSIVHFSTSHFLRTFDGQSHPGTHGTRIPPSRSSAKK
jgi:hypothetical protein